MTSKPLDIRHGNVYVRNRTRGRALAVLLRKRHGQRPDGATIMEGGWAVKMAGRLAGYRVTRATAGEPRGRTDVLVLVHKRLEYLGELAIQVQPAMPRFGNAAHTRYVVAQLFNHPTTGRTALIGWHPTPGPVALRTDPDHPITKGYVAALEDLVRIKRLLTVMGYKVVVGSDTQIQASSAVPWRPIAKLADAGVITRAQAGIDILAADQRLQAVDAGVLAPAGEETGADHPFLYAELEPAPQQMFPRLHDTVIKLVDEASDHPKP